MGRSISGLKTGATANAFAALAAAFALSLLAGAAAQEAGAQQAEDCTAIPDGDARLACYDRLHGLSAPAAPVSTPSTADERMPAPSSTAAPSSEAPPSATAQTGAAEEPVATTSPDPGVATGDSSEVSPAVAPAVAPAAGAAAAPETTPEPAADPGFGAEQLPESREARQAEQKPDSMVTTVTAMGESNTRKHWFRLENGQLWEQASIESTNIREGDAVRVSRGLFGSYTMRRADGSSRSTRVQRRE